MMIVANVPTFLFTVVTMMTMIPTIVALPTGSPICAVGAPAVRSNHTSRSLILTGPISTSNFIVTIGNIVLDSTKNNTIPSEIDVSYNLSSTSGVLFRGVLIVLNQPGVTLTSNLNATNLNEASPLFQPQTSCPGFGYSGITHTTRDDKTSVTGFLRLPAGQAANLDVNIVLFVNSVASIYYYTQFKLVGSTPTSAPIPTAPVKPPTTAPVKAPTTAPVKPPTTAPVKAPTKAPITTTPTAAPANDPCGLLGLSILCFDGCGFLGRIFGFCD